MAKQAPCVACRLKCCNNLLVFFTDNTFRVMKINFSYFNGPDDFPGTASIHAYNNQKNRLCFSMSGFLSPCSIPCTLTSTDMNPTKAIPLCHRVTQSDANCDSSCAYLNSAHTSIKALLASGTAICLPPLSVEASRCASQRPWAHYQEYFASCPTSKSSPKAFLLRMNLELVC